MEMAYAFSYYLYWSKLEDIHDGPDTYALVNHNGNLIVPQDISLRMVFLYCLYDKGAMRYVFVNLIDGLKDPRL